MLEFQKKFKAIDMIFSLTLLHTLVRVNVSYSAQHQFGKIIASTTYMVASYAPAEQILWQTVQITEIPGPYF